MEENQSKGLERATSQDFSEFENLEDLNEFYLSEEFLDEEEIPKQFRSTAKSDGARSRSRGFC